jgi:hypothetical protein
MKKARPYLCKKVGTNGVWGSTTSRNLTPVKD